MPKRFDEGLDVATFERLVYDANVPVIETSEMKQWPISHLPSVFAILHVYYIQTKKT